MGEEASLDCLFCEAVFGGMFLFIYLFLGGMFLKEFSEYGVGAEVG